MKKSMYLDVILASCSLCGISSLKSVTLNSEVVLVMCDFRKKKYIKMLEFSDGTLVYLFSYN